MEIKNCPHCNGTADIIREFKSGFDIDIPDRYFVMVRCDICGATGKRYEVTEDVWGDWDKLLDALETSDAVGAWNMRSMTEDIKSYIDEHIERLLNIDPETSHKAAGDTETE